MDTKKIKVNAAQDGSLKFELVRKEFVKGVKIMAQEHNALGQEVPFYICLEQEFDQGKNQAALIMLGDRKKDWKDHIKVQYKNAAQRKKILWGTCFLEVEEGAKTLQLIPEKGNAKFPMIKKEVKPFLKKAGVAINLLKSLQPQEQDDSSQDSGGAAEADNDPKALLAAQLKKEAAAAKKQYAALSSMSDKKELTKAIYQLHALCERFQQSQQEYDSLDKEGAAEAFFPKGVQYMRNMDQKLQEKYGKVIIIGDAFKKQVAKLNKILTAVGKPTINI